MYGSTDMQVFRTRTSPGPGAARSTSTRRKFSAVGQPDGRETRWISRVVRVMPSILPAGPGAGRRGASRASGAVGEITPPTRGEGGRGALGCKSRTRDDTYYAHGARRTEPKGMTAP